VLRGEGGRGVAQDNLSRGNLGAVHVLEKLAPSRFRFVEADLGNHQDVRRLALLPPPPLLPCLGYCNVARH
jgi:hypothetical protein